MLDALRALGVDVDDGGRGALPFTVRGTGSVPGGTVVIDASASSQFVSALLLAGARYEQGVDVRHDGKPVPSLPHIDMTVAMLREHGVEVDDAEANRWAVAPGPVQAVDHVIEPDLSNAAPFLALAAVTRRHGHRARLARAHHPARRRAARDPGADGLRRSPAPTTACGSPAPTGCRASTSTCTTSASSPRRSPRCARWPTARRTCAASPTSAATRPTGSPPSPPSSARSAPTSSSTPTASRSRPAPLHGGVFHTYADHRMAHAGVIIGAAVDGVLVEDVATTGKTFPDFAGFWSGLLVT